MTMKNYHQRNILQDAMIKLIIGYLKKKYLRKKFELLSAVVKNKVHILSIFEIIFDNSFPVAKFLIKHLR